MQTKKIRWTRSRKAQMSDTKRRVVGLKRTMKGGFLKKIGRALRVLKPGRSGSAKIAGTAVLGETFNPFEVSNPLFKMQPISKNKQEVSKNAVSHQKEKESQNNFNYLMGAITLNPTKEMQKIINNGALQAAKLAITEINEKLNNPNLSANNRAKYNRQLARLESKVNPVYQTIENPYNLPKPPANKQPENPYNQHNPYSLASNYPGPNPTMRAGPVLGVQNPPATGNQSENPGPLYNTPEGTQYSIGRFSPGSATKYERPMMQLPSGPLITSSRTRVLEPP